MTSQKHSQQTQQPTPAPDSIFQVAVRYGLATVLIVLSILGIWKLTPASGVKLFSEGSPLEWAQFGILLLAAAVFFIGSRLTPHYRQLFIILSLLPILASIREQDKALDNLIPSLGWQFPFFIVLIAGITFGVRNRTALASQTRTFINHRAFGLMWAGLILAVPFGQMIGHGGFLEQLFGEKYERPIKRLIEECAETIGYIMIFLASIDWLCSARRKPSA